MAEIRAVSPNGTALSMKRGAEGWKAEGEDVDKLFTNIQKELRNDPDARNLFESGNKDAVWDMLFSRLANRIGGEYTAVRK